MAPHLPSPWNLVALVLACLWPCAAPAEEPEQPFRAGAFAVDVTPEKFPVIVNGGFLPVVADKANDRLHARWLVLDDARGPRRPLRRRLLPDAARPARRGEGTS